MTETPPTTTDRVRAMRERRRLLGLTRLDLYAHPDDHEALKRLLARLLRARARKK